MVIHLDFHYNIKINSMKYNLIVVNGRFLEQKITGVQRFALETVKAFDKILYEEKACQNFPEIILAISNKAKKENIPSLKCIKILTVGNRHGILWSQTDLALYIIRNKALGIHLCNAVPFLTPRGIVCIHDISYKTHPEFVTTRKHRLIKIWHLLQNRVSLKKSIAVLTVSKTSKKEICDVYKISSNKVTVTYNGWQHFSPQYDKSVTLEQFPFLKSKNFFFSMSSLGKNKNFKWILEIARRNPGLIFAVAGNNDVKKYGETFCIEKKLNNVHYLGYVTDDQAKMLMKESKAFIFPSIYEGFGIPPLEALAMGTKVICSNASCLPEIFMDTVYYIDPYNCDINFDELLKTKVAPAEKVLNLYTWENTAKRIFEVIISCISEEDNHKGTSKNCNF